MKNMSLIKLWVASSILIVQSFSQAVMVNQYRITTTPELEAYSKFQVSGAQLRVRKDGRVRLKYHLPKELVGELEGSVSAEGRIKSMDKPFTLTGNNTSRVECQVKDKTASCHMVYNYQLPVFEEGGEEQVVEYLKNTIQDPVELDARIRVLGQFLRGTDLNAVASHEAGGWFDELSVRFD